MGGWFRSQGYKKAMGIQSKMQVYKYVHIHIYIYIYIYTYIGFREFGPRV